MKVLHVISSLDPRAGGPTTGLIGLTTAIAAAGLEVRVLAAWASGEDRSVEPILTANGVGMRWVGPTHGLLKSSKHMSRECDEAVADADVVHLHGLWEEVQHVAARAARRRKTPYIFSPHGMLDPWSLRQGWWKKRLYMAVRLRRDLTGASGLHFTTVIERDLTRPLALRAQPIVEPNGLSLSEFAVLPEPGSFRRQHGIAAERHVVLFLSRLHHKKGLDLLIPAFARLKDRDVLLVLAGPDAGGHQATVEAMIAKEGIGERVLFTGHLKGADRIAALADADLFVLSSYQENFGIVVIEALAAGTPVVISDQVNLYQDVLAAGVGSVVPMDRGRLTAEMDRWLADRALRESTGRLAREFATTRYDWTHIAHRWIDHYKRLMDASRRSAEERSS